MKKENGRNNRRKNEENKEAKKKKERSGYSLGGARGLPRNNAL